MDAKIAKNTDTQHFHYKKFCTSTQISYFCTHILILYETIFAFYIGRFADVCPSP